MSGDESQPRVPLLQGSIPVGHKEGACQLQTLLCRAEHGRIPLASAHPLVYAMVRNSPPVQQKPAIYPEFPSYRGPTLPLSPHVSAMPTPLPPGQTVGREVKESDVKTLGNGHIL